MYVRKSNEFHMFFFYYKRSNSKNTSRETNSISYMRNTSGPHDCLTFTKNSNYVRVNFFLFR